MGNKEKNGARYFYVGIYISVLLLSLLRETFILILDLSRTRAETCSMFVINFYEFMG